MYIAKRRTTVAGHDWLIGYNPCSDDGHGVEWLKFSLTRGGGGAGGVPASFTCRLLDQTGRLGPSKEERVSASFHLGREHELTLMQRCKLESSGYLKDNSFLVECTITVLVTNPRVVDALTGVDGVGAGASAVAPSSDLHRHFGDLLRSQKGADATFVISGETFPAHRCVLAARSPVFMAELFGGMQENASRRIEIRDMEAEAFRALLHFIYTDTVPELDQLEQLEKEQATIMAQHLLDAADRCGLERLKRILPREGVRYHHHGHGRDDVGFSRAAWLLQAQGEVHGVRHGCPREHPSSRRN